MALSLPGLSAGFQPYDQQDDASWQEPATTSGADEVSGGLDTSAPPADEVGSTLSASCMVSAGCLSCTLSKPGQSLPSTRAGLSHLRLGVHADTAVQEHKSHLCTGGGQLHTEPAVRPGSSQRTRAEGVGWRLALALQGAQAAC